MRSTKLKTKMEKGITLIALIITIVILLILAAVAISSITNDGILQYAQNAAKDYNQAVANEQAMLEEYLNYLNDIGKAKVGKIASKNSTINGKQYTETNPVIPAGFMPINTTTSSWEATDLAAEVKKGLVISDGTSEFVWIPVATLSEFAKVTSGTDSNGKKNYEGVLYDFVEENDGTLTSTEKSNYGQSTTSFREPANLDSSLYDNTTNLSTWTEILYQESFNKMVESVAEYKGFYVGRYETSLKGSVAQSIPGVAPMNNINWFRMYENSKAYSISNMELGVVSEMIWGCQWDAMLKFILTGSEANHVKSTSNVGHISSDFTGKPYYTGGTNYSTVYTGSTNYDDIASNIYDLEGNVRELCQEALDTFARVAHGGSTSYGVSPSDYSTYYPTDNESSPGSRLALYVKF